MYRTISNHWESLLVWTLRVRHDSDDIAELISVHIEAETEDGGADIVPGYPHQEILVIDRIVHQPVLGVLVLLQIRQFAAADVELGRVLPCNNDTMRRTRRWRKKSADMRRI